MKKISIDRISLSLQDQLMLRALHSSPLFIFGLLLKLLLILFALPRTQKEWFLPFITQTLHQFNLDPWTYYLDQGGTVLAFPYGIAMYLTYAPLTGSGMVVDGLLSTSWLAKVGFGLTSLLLDYGILLSIAFLIRDFPKTLLLATYWCSPIVIYIAYWHGQIDLLPIFLLITGIGLLHGNKPIAAGFLLGLSASSKYSMLAAIPFILIYLYRNRRFRDYLIPLGVATFLTATLTFIPFLASPGFLTMSLMSREVEKVYSVSLSYGENLRLFLLPIVYMVALYLTWRIGRITKDLFLIYTGIGFFIILLLLPPSSGWFMWIVPFLTYYQIKVRQNYLWLTFLFSVLYVVYSLLYSTGADIPFLSLNIGIPLATSNAWLETERFQSLSLTALNATALLVCIRMYIYGIRRNRYYQSSHRPFCIGISGDSGVGKDTLALAISDVLGHEAVTHIWGDDYHKWERNNPMWSTTTHLNPNANNLARLARDVSLLLNGHAISKRSYDHATGKFTAPLTVRAKECVIVSGLHTLYLGRLREITNLKIFLNADEELRVFWNLNRDTKQRGHAREKLMAVLEKQIADTNRFIHRQARYSNLAFKLIPASSFELSNPQREPRLKLMIRMDNGFFHEELVRYLVALCGAHVDVEHSEDLEKISLLIEGDINHEDISHVATCLIPNLEDLVTRNPVWHDGCTGIMQVVVLAHLADILHQGRRFAHV